MEAHATGGLDGRAGHESSATACGMCCGHANDGTRSECADCPILVMSVRLLATAAELDATTSSYERLKIACEHRGAELTRLRREKRGGTVDVRSK